MDKATRIEDTKIARIYHSLNRLEDDVHKLILLANRISGDDGKEQESYQDDPPPVARLLNNLPTRFSELSKQLGWVHNSLVESVYELGNDEVKAHE